NLRRLIQGSGEIYEETGGVSVENIVRRSWQRHLGLDSINDDDNFFSIGGHSLSALAVINDVSEGIGREVELRLIFEHQSLGEFISCICKLVERNDSNVEKAVKNRMDPEKIRASPLQVPILERMNRDKSKSFMQAYNITARIHLKKEISREDLKCRFNSFCLRHPSLRTFFVFDHGFFHRTVSATESFLPIGSSLRNEGDFDVFVSPPISISLQNDHIRIFVSHLIVDGHSMKNLVNELIHSRDLEQRTSIEEFTDLTREIEMKSTESSLSFWKTILESFVFNPLQSLPRSLKTRYDAGSLTKEYSTLGKSIEEITSTHHCTPFTALLSSFALTLQSHSLQRNSSVSIGWSVDLRSPRTKNAIGFATNTLVTAVDASKTSTEDLISTVSEQVIGALQHRFTPFEDLLRISGAPNLFDVMLVMDPFSVEEGEGFEVMHEEQPFTKFPLTLFVHNSQGNMTVTAHFMKDLFSSQSIESILSGWEETLIRWADGGSRPMRSIGESADTIVKRQRQFVRMEDLVVMCSPFVRCRTQLENGRIVMEYDSAVQEDAVIDFIKHSVPLFLHPDELRSCSFPSRIPSSFLLSPHQLQMFFLSREDPSGHYNVPFVQRFDKSNVQVHNLSLALHHVRQRNEALRTRIDEMEGEAGQIVLSATESYYCIDPVDASEEEAKRRLLDPLELSLDLSHSTARLTLFSTEDELILFLVISHVICDGWSTGLMQNQFSSIYEMFQRKGKPTLSKIMAWDEYGYFLRRSNHVGDMDEDYLNEVISSLLEVRSLLEMEDGKELSYSFHLDKSSSIAMKKRAAAMNSTPFIVFLQSLSRSLHSIFRMERVNIGTPVANRSSSTIDVIGCFMNTIVIPIHHSDSSSKTIESSLALNLPNFELIKSIRSRLNRADIRLFDVFVNCRYGMESEKNVRVDGVRTSEIHKLPPIFPLEIYVEEEEGEYTIEVKMKRGEEKTMERIVESLKKELTHGEKDADSKEYQTEFEWTSESSREDIPELDLPSILYHNSQLNGGRIALRTPQRGLTYSELWSLLVGMARTIREDFFISNGEILKVDDVIGVRMKHGEEAILSCLSVLVAGAVYLPLLQNWPDERVKHAVEETNCGMVIEEMKEEIDCRERRGQWKRRNLTEDAAYVIYTSGTTGKPKGVVAVHKGVVNMLNSTVRSLAMRNDDVIFQFTKFVFDNSVLEIWLSLSSGATLFVDDESFTHHRFLSSLHRFGITHALLFPGLVASFTSSQLSLLSSLRGWCMGAEKASQPLVDRSIEEGIKIVQVYGPTETTTYALSREMKREDHANNLGRALRNTKLRVKRNEEGVGELEIAGEGLMRGYVGRTRDESFSNGFYATGDLVQVQSDGTVIFVGRNDRQVKVRGYRVELNEVENVVLRFAEQVKVLFFEDQQQLVCFAKSPLSAEQLRSCCAKIVPDYMTPSRFISLVSFPLTDNSKVDETKLREMVNRRIRRDEKDEGENNHERRLIQVIQRVGFRFFSLDDNFVEIGGQSIIALRLTTEIEKEFGVKISAHEVYRVNTLQNVHKNMIEIGGKRGSMETLEGIRRMWRSILNTEA
ncbi:hypothetical protein PMAYCL1PPCAC_18711, partial [Pristionchus mayeri]